MSYHGRWWCQLWHPYRPFHSPRRKQRSRAESTVCEHLNFNVRAGKETAASPCMYRRRRRRRFLGIRRKRRSPSRRTAYALIAHHPSIPLPCIHLPNFNIHPGLSINIIPSYPQPPSPYFSPSSSPASALPLTPDAPCPAVS